jgi:membrane-bound serine protease (ClpP class)
MTTVIILLLAGALLLALETILPGLIAGAIGLGCVIAGVVVSYSELGVRAGNLTLALTLVGLIVGTLLYLRYFPESRAARMFVSRGVVGNVDAERTELLGRSGTALTTLRPSGTAVIDGRRVDVVTEGGLIEAGTPVKVIAIEGMRTVVRAI